MPTTSNFGWTTPADTDLVKDGAAAIRTLGNGIDTSLVDLKGGTTGQILSKNSNTDLDYIWINNDQGDITAVNVTSPITGGGSSGDVTISIQDATTAQKGAVQLENSTSSTSTTTAAVPASVKSAYDLANGAIAKSLIDAEGDLIVGDAADAVQRLALGTNGQVLTVDTAVDGKIKWATAASGGMTLISTTTLSGASTTINGFSGYNDLLVVISGITYNTADEIFQIRPNASSSLAYAILNRNANNVTYANAISDATINTLNDPKRSGGNNAFVLELKNYATTSYHKPYKFYGGCETSTEWVGFHSGGFLKTNSAITSLVLQTASGYTLTGGQVLTYGVK